MCIAIYSPKGTKVPCEEYLHTSFIHNDDGAGFAFNTDNRDVQIVKGLMTWNDFINTFRRYDNEYNFEKRGVLIHFRITTHGGTNKECCHPFPLTSDIASMRKPVCHSRYAVIHNGIIQLTSFEARSADKCSDTMMFISKYLSKIATNQGWFKNKTNWELIYDLADSKIAVLNGYGEIRSTAGFTQDADGNWYSNSSYKEARVTTSLTPYRWGAWDDDVWDDYGDYGRYDYGYNKPSNYNVKKYTYLMRLRPGEFIWTVDDDYLEADDEWGLYVDESDAIFVQDTKYEIASDSGINQVIHPAYWGDAMGVYSGETGLEIEFRKDAFAMLSPSDYVWGNADNDDETEKESTSAFDILGEEDETKLDAYAKQNK